MRHLFYAIPILLLAVLETNAQSPLDPTINYQGRASDESGNAVTGTRSVQLTIYDASSGGNALFTETHNDVDFNEHGIFTVIIGGATPGGIPREIGFDEPRWLGVTIADFNDGQELPRLRFHGSPYAFESFHSTVSDRSDSSESAARSDIAEQAQYADSAGAAARADQAASATRSDSSDVADQLAVPATLDGNSDNPLLSISNEGGAGLEVNGGTELQGDDFALVTNGKDSTTKHYIAAEEFGNGSGNTASPDPGALYRDNAPIAWATVQPDGSVLADFGIESVNHNPNNPGRYLVVLKNALSTDGANRPEMSVVITPQMDVSSPSTQPVLAGWDFAIDQSTNQPRNDAVDVLIRGFETGVDNGFAIVVFGRPAN